MIHSPVQATRFRDRQIYIKRDDLFRSAGLFSADIEASNAVKHVLAGNKARKLQTYIQNDFPDVSHVVSYGSVQSNMLASLAVMANIKGWQLEFYVSQVPANLLNNPRGNYQLALEYGANIITVEAQSSLREYIENQVLPGKQNVLFIPEGGATVEAEVGIKALADELIEWVEQQEILNPKLMLPSGTGTTAFFLQKHVPFEVLTCACVGSREYLRGQFLELDNNNGKKPTILPAVTGLRGGNGKFQFGKLYKECYQIWNELKRETGITFDLLYDPQGWMHMMEYLGSAEGGVSEPPPTMIYLHQGGLLGNETMLQRYKRKFGR